MLPYDQLSHTALFQGVAEQDLQAMLSCLGGIEKRFSKEETVYHTGDQVRQIGLVLTGGVNIISCDAWGNASILDHVAPGQVFAEAYACISAEQLMVDVVASEQSQILFLDVGRVLKSCSSACVFHSRLLRNLLEVMAGKNLILTRRMHHIAPKSIRARLLSYLSFQAVRQGKASFDIPFDRQQLADYLSVERSALSNELSKMRRDGLVDCHKNHFILHIPARTD